MLVLSWHGSFTVFNIFRYPTSIAALSFSADSSVLAIASSYMYENDEQKSIPEDNIYIRNVSDQETKPK
jgi:cell cycle arrest protein BUB3